MLRHAHGSCHEWKSCLTGARFPRAAGGGGTVRSAALKSTHQSFQLTSRGEGLRQWRNCLSWPPRPSQPGPIAAVRPLDDDEFRAANVEQSSSKHSHWSALAAACGQKRLRQPVRQRTRAMHPVVAAPRRRLRGVCGQYIHSCILTTLTPSQRSDKARRYCSEPRRHAAPEFAVKGEGAELRVKGLKIEAL